jgi:outer membrane biogenesis lipoprotein LolB
MTRYLPLILASAFLAACSASSSKTELEKISEIAVETCGGADKVETVPEEGFTCKD